MEPEVRERLERLERMATSLVEVAKSHEQRLSKLEEVMITLAEQVSSHEGLMEEWRGKMDELRAVQAATSEQMKHTDERLNVVVKMMDEWIRERRRGNGEGPGPTGTP